MAEMLEGRRFWHLNSSAHGGGVAELLNWFLPLARTADIDARRLTLSAPGRFFELTKGLHHLLHESGQPLPSDARKTYERCLEEAAGELLKLVEPGDLVVVPNSELFTKPVTVHGSSPEAGPASPTK